MIMLASGKTSGTLPQIWYKQCVVSQQTPDQMLLGWSKRMKMRWFKGIVSKR